MKKKVLAELGFASIISEAYAQTQTGAEFLNRYKSFVMSNPISCATVNHFMNEARQHTYDKGIYEALNTVAEYLNENTTLWALTTACENIYGSNSAHNYINRNAARHVENLLEMNEDDVVKYIKAGALRNVMFCESFRNIAKQVFKSNPIIEATAEYTVSHPTSMIENCGDGICFEVKGTLYEIDGDKNIQESDWSNVSHEFKVVSSLLESRLCAVDETGLTIKYNNAEYRITEANKCTRIGREGTREFTSEELRGNNRLILMSTLPVRQKEVAGVLEAIAVTCENYDHIVNMDNVSVYTTNRDRFMVIESGTNLYSTLLESSHIPSKWTINENVIEALSFIQSKTNVSLSEVYDKAVKESMDQISEEDKKVLESEIREQANVSRRERVSKLVEKFKNDPVKLAVLSTIAENLD